MIDITNQTGYAGHMIHMATVDDLEGNLHQMPLHEVTDWYHQLGEKQMQDEYEAAKTQIQQLDPENSTPEQEAAVVKLCLTMLVDIAQSLNRIANNP